MTLESGMRIGDVSYLQYDMRHSMIAIGMLEVGLSIGTVMNLCYRFPGLYLEPQHPAHLFF